MHYMHTPLPRYDIQNMFTGYNLIFPFGYYRKCSFLCTKEGHMSDSSRFYSMRLVHSSSCHLVRKVHISLHEMPHSTGVVFKCIIVVRVQVWFLNKMGLQRFWDMNLGDRRWPCKTVYAHISILQTTATPTSASSSEDIEAAFLCTAKSAEPYHTLIPRPPV